MQSSTKAIVPNIVSKSRGGRNSTAVTAGECTLYIVQGGYLRR